MNKSKFLRLIYFALVDIRANSDPETQPIAYRLSDLVHHLPLALDQIDDSPEATQDLVDELFLRAERIGAKNWLHNQMQRLDD